MKIRDTTSDRKTVTRLATIDKAVRRFRPVFVAAAHLLIGGATSASAQAPPPDGEWSTLVTPHFEVTFPSELEALGRRAAERSERAWSVLSERFVDPPRGMIQLLVTDHVDFSNGSARWAPYDQIVIYARPPMEGYGLSYFDDWLELVITHEVAHVFHMNEVGWLGSLGRRIFGRVSSDWPIAPNYSTPKWFVEGLATYYESLTTESGRVKGSRNEMILRTAALEGGFERLDQASGISPVWPSGQTRYVYGSEFLQHIAGDSGPESITAFAENVGGQWFPYRINSAATDAFGISVSDAYREWSELRRREAENTVEQLRAYAPLSEPEAITRGSRQAYYPRVSPDGSRLAYIRSDGRSDWQVRVAEPDGTGDRKLSRVSSNANFDWLPDGGLVVAQLEFTDRYHLRSGLARISSEGRESWLVRGARLDQPSVFPDGNALVAVQDSAGTNRLVRVDTGTGEITALTDAREDVHWSYPAVSPNGRWIAAARWTPGAFYDLWLLDARGRSVRRITEDRAVDQAPAWSPGGDALFWSSDRNGIPNLYAVAVEPSTGETGVLRQVTNMTGGAAFPSVDPDGRWIYFSSYHVEGWDVERLPFLPESWFDPLPEAAEYIQGGEAGPERYARMQPGEVRPYDPLSTLRPTFWELTYEEPIRRGGRRIQKEGIGFRTSQTDLVGRHSYDLGATFRSSGRTDLTGQYTFRGLGNPHLTLDFDQRHFTDGPFGLGGGEVPADTVYLTQRERSVGLSVPFARQRMRSRVDFSLGARHLWESVGFLGLDLSESSISPSRPESRFGEVSATLGFTTARGYAFSTSRQKGVAGLVRGRVREELALADSLTGEPGRDRSVRDLIGRLELFTPVSGFGFSDHTLALRVAGGAAYGPGANAFSFSVGGSSGRPEGISGLELFGGRSLFFPVRGYFSGERRGRYAWTATAEYRIPLLNVHRGFGLFPFHMDRISGIGFFDAGNAWGPVRPELELRSYDNPRGRPLASVGAELQAELLFLFNSPLTVRVGAAHRLLNLPGEGFYIRVGTTF